jgi:hypothetical protein
MRLSRWFLGLACVVGLGCLQVAQRTAIVRKGYALGERMNRVHAQRTDVSLETMQVAGLLSPAHLSQVAREQRMNLAAWWALRAEPSTATPLVHVASVQSETGD